MRARGGSRVDRVWLASSLDGWIDVRMGVMSSVGGWMYRRVCRWIGLGRCIGWDKWIG